MTEGLKGSPDGAGVFAAYENAEGTCQTAPFESPSGDSCKRATMSRPPLTLM